MSVRWEDVVVRARGLGTHMLDRADLERMAGAPDIDTLAVMLAKAGIEVADPGGGRAEPSRLERAVRRSTERMLAIIARWCGSRADYLAVFFDDEDRRTVRSLVRGAVADVDTAARLSGLLPTPRLPGRVIEELAGMQTPAAIATTLKLLGHPYGPALEAEAARPVPDLLALEGALSRAYARRAARAARGGGRHLRRFLRETIALDNAQTALVLATERHDLDVAACFSPEGHPLRASEFVAAATAGGAGAAARIIEAAFASTAFAGIFEATTPPEPDLELRILEARLRAELRRAKQWPLSVSPVLAFFLQLRAQAADLMGIIWGIALRQPASVLTERLVSVP